jgi:hypothetical protein
MTEVAVAPRWRHLQQPWALLAAAGAVMLLLALAAPALKITSSPDFGWKQLLLSVAGACALGVGLRMQRSWSIGRAHGASLAIIAGAGALAFGQIMTLRPFNADNLQGLSVSADSPLDLATQPFSNLPVYRPMATLAIWLQHAIVGIDPPSYFLVNLLLWLACVGLVYALMVQLTGMRVVAFSTALLLLVDRRANPILQVIGDRATTLAIVFGLAAVLIVLRASEHRLTRGRLALIFVLLLLSSLGKEYGMAFMAVVATAAICWRPAGWKALIAVAFGALAVRVALHLLIAGGASAPYCETLGYFRQVRQACFNELDPNNTQYNVLLTGSEAIKQHLWNMAATFAGTAFPSMFSQEGAYQWPNVGWTRDSPTGDILDTYIGIGLVLLMLIALIRMPRRALPFLVLALANAVLSLMLYRVRNELLGVVGLYILAGLGAAALLRLLGPRISWGWLVAPLALVAAVAFAQGDRRDGELTQFMAQQSVYPGNLCGRVIELKTGTFVELSTVQELRHWYGFPDPDCKRGWGGEAKPERLGPNGDPIGS